MVLDTNVLISALLFKGTLAEIFDLIVGGNITPCLTPETLEELQQVLARPKFRDALMRASLSSEMILEALLQQSVVAPTPPWVLPIVLADQSDVKFLACAVLCNADVLVTGDCVLLALKTYAEIPIVTPRDFLREYV